MGQSVKAKRRRWLWVEAIQRQGFVPIWNTKVCSRHFVSAIAVSDHCSSIDYIPSVSMGYEKQTPWIQIQKILGNINYYLSYVCVLTMIMQ